LLFTLFCPIGQRLDWAGKRTGAWIKVKLDQEQEFVIGGYM
jgi:hypothetical protein